MAEAAFANIRSQRFMVYLTIALMVLFGISVFGLMGFMPPPGANLSPDQAVQVYAEHNLRFKLGVFLALIASGCVMPLTVVTSVQMARLEKGFPVWAWMQALTGAVGTAFFWLPVLIFATAAFSPGRPPELTLLMHEFGWLAFITPLSLFPMQLISIIYIAFTKDEDDKYSAFPRWLGYLTAWNLIQSFGGPIAVIFRTGVFSWNGLFPFYLPLLLFSLWLPAMCYCLLRALKHQESLAR
jgi:hypothetical protein